MSDKKCVICKKPAPQSCSLCNGVNYCGQEHQRSDWKNHKSKCAPFRIDCNEIYGRHLVATRDIKQGELILKKSPLITGPKMASFPMCLGCHKRLNTAQKFYECSKCAWPLCNQLCELCPAHLDECRIFRLHKYVPHIDNVNQRIGAYAIILPLRSLIMKTLEPNKYKTLMGMQSHLENMKNTRLFSILSANLMPIFAALKVNTNSDEVLNICSIFDTNAFEIRDTNGFINIRGLYPMVSLITHDCTVNTKHSFHGIDHQIHVIATVDIEKGQKITTTYTQTLWGTLNRRAHLKLVKNFDCTCQRCSDPSEFGTYAGSFYCYECRKANLSDACPKLTSSNPLFVDADWSCAVCGLIVNVSAVSSRNESLKREIAQIDRCDPANFEAFLEKYQNLLHGTNCHVLEIKYALTQMYGNLKGFTLEDISDELLDRKIDICTELLQVSDKLEPGYSRFRGKILNDLQAAIAVKTKRELDQGQVTLIEARGSLKKAINILQEATKILQTEPEMEEDLNKNVEILIKMIN